MSNKKTWEKTEKEFASKASIFLTVSTILLIAMNVYNNHKHIKEGFNHGLELALEYPELAETRSDIHYIWLGGKEADGFKVYCAEALVFDGTATKTFSNTIVVDLKDGDDTDLKQLIFGQDYKAVTKAVPKSCNAYNSLPNKADKCWYTASYGGGPFGDVFDDIFSGSASLTICREQNNIRNIIEQVMKN